VLSASLTRDGQLIHDAMNAAGPFGESDRAIAAGT
jgi:hypothetical protein